MPYRILLWSLLLIAVVSTGLQLVKGFAQDPATVPAPPPAAPPVATYTPPDYHDVLAGKAPLRVLILSKLNMLAWKGDAEVRVITVPDNKCIYTCKPAEMVGLVRVAQDQSCWLRQDGKNFCAIPTTLRLESDKPFKLWTPRPDTWNSYPSPLIITPTPNVDFSVARELPLEEYLRNVVPSEMPASFHPQALAAQAVIARTYALCKLGRHAEDGADVCDNVHCQMFIGADSKRAAATDKAVADTRGVVLLYGDKLAELYYHANCGGVTDDAGLLWGPEYARPYLAGVCDLACGKIPAEPTITGVLAATDCYCKGSNSAHWTRNFTPAEVDALAAKTLPIVTNDANAKVAHVTNLAVEERTPNGRVADLRVEGVDAQGNAVSFVVYGDQVRWLFGTGSAGPDGLWSTLFDLTVARDADGKVTGYTFHGAGRGHGIGLCQWGADGRAKAGQSYRDILNAYYPGTRLSEEK